MLEDNGQLIIAIFGLGAVRVIFPDDARWREARRLGR
jgi:hypothetical protein